MTEERVLGPHGQKSYSYRELPIGSTSIGICDDVIKTGLWRFIRPVIKTKTPPCSEACPAGVDVRGFISLMKRGLFKEAYQLYIEENPFPAICGRVCFHPCESDCNRKDFDKAVAINALECFMSDFEVPLEQMDALSKRQVAIVGSGPSGMACAHYLARLGHRVTVFEEQEALGGLLRTGIPPYRLPRKVVDREIEKLRGMGIEFRSGYRIDRKNWNSLGNFEAIFLSSGAGQEIPFDPSSRMGGKVISGLKFLRSFHKGDEIPLGKKVVVIGGGNTAIDAARVALRLGAFPTVIYRRDKDQMPAFHSEVDDAIEEGVEIIYLASPIKIESRGRSLQIECIKNRLGEKGQDGRPRPIPIEGSNFIVKANTILSAAGEVPDLSLLPPEIQVSNGLVSVDLLGSTNLPGIFAGGDLIHQPRSVVRAIGSGKRGAMAIDGYLRGRSGREWVESLRIGEKGSFSFKQYCKAKFSQEKKDVIHSEKLNFNYFVAKERSDKSKISKKARASFQEIYENLSLEEAIGEAQRCFSCGMCYFCDNCYLLCPDASVIEQDDDALNVIDYEYCKGCGICENECPVGVIDMEKET